MRPLTSIIVCSIFTSASVFSQKKERNTDQRPNILFILTDDQSLGYMGFEGNPIVKTPHLDKLAREGIYFSNAYITSAICTPSRVSIFTGQYERKHGVNFNSGTSLSPEAWALTYPVLLRNSGYYTGYVGKNHSPVGEGGYESGLIEESFDYWYAGHGHLTFYPPDRHEIFRHARLETQVEVMEEGALDFLSNEHRLQGAVSFLDGLPPGKPFCLSISFNLPHDAGAESMRLKDSDDEIYKSLYRDVEIPLPPNYLAKADIVEPKLPEDVLRYKDRQTGYDYVDNPEDVKERIIRQYQAMTGIDRMVGKLREVLAEKKMDKNTIIIFTSDHGMFMGEFGLGGKALCYQKCIHVPMIIYNPFSTKKARGIVIDELVQTIDIAPTMLSIAGLEIPASMQGKDLSGMLKGNVSPVREYIFTENLWSIHYGNPRIEAVQNKEWKYIRYYKNENLSARKLESIAREMGVHVNKVFRVTDRDMAVYRHFIESSLQGEPAVYEELFHLTSDPKETTNLVDRPQHQEVLEAMRKAWWDMLVKARGDGAPMVLRYIP